MPGVFLWAVFAVADVLDVLDHAGAEPMLPHDGQHPSVHQVMGPEAVGVATVPSGEVLADVEPFTLWILVANHFSTLSLVIFAYLQRKKQTIARDINPFPHLPQSLRKA